VKLSAAKALLEVETKESDVMQYIKFVELLDKLKSHRSEIQHRSTELVTMEADLKFKNTIKSLQEFLLMRKEEYEKEKKALHVIMEEKVQDRIAAATAAQKPEQEPMGRGQDDNTTPQVAALLHIRLSSIPKCLLVISLVIIVGDNGMLFYLLLVVHWTWILCYHPCLLQMTGRLIYCLDSSYILIYVTIVTVIL